MLKETFFPSIKMKKAKIIKHSKKKMLYFFRYRIHEADRSAGWYMTPNWLFFFINLDSSAGVQMSSCLAGNAFAITSGLILLRKARSIARQIIRNDNLH